MRFASPFPITQEDTRKVKTQTTRQTVEVTADAEGIVSHAGARLLAELADRLGLTATLSEAMAPTRERRSAHDPGVVLRDLIVSIADGGDCVTDLGVLRVFLLIGGGAAFAAVKLPKKSVGAKQLKNNAVTSPKVKNHSLLAKDFKAGQLPKGPKGSVGPRGATGPQGPAGSDAFGELVYKEGGLVEIGNNEQAGVQVGCDSGYHVVGGGIYSSSGELGESVNSSYPSQRTNLEFGNEGWAGFVDNTTGGTASAQAFAICAKAGKVSGP
jgi:hypothetical protein